MRTSALLRVALAAAAEERATPKRLIQTRVSKALADKIEADAAAAGMSVATWLRVFLIQHFDSSKRG
jgi:predicted HicB family RNase H-like nuclease